MKIMHMHGVFDNVVTKIIGFAIHARFYSATCHPHRKTTRVMIPSVIVFGKLALAIIGSSKFASPDYQRLIQQAPCFKSVISAADAWSASLH